VSAPLGHDAVGLTVTVLAALGRGRPRFGGWQRFCPCATRCELRLRGVGALSGRHVARSGDGGHECTLVKGLGWGSVMCGKELARMLSLSKKVVDGRNSTESFI
jgi:hypothetical protein